MVYGTSLTASPGGAWTIMLKNWFETQFSGKVHFFNSGMSGQNSDEGVAQLQPKVLAHQPDLVFIEFSMNNAQLCYRAANHG